MLDLMLNQLNYIPQSQHVILVVWCIVTWLLLLVNSADINQIFFFFSDSNRDFLLAQVFHRGTDSSRWCSPLCCVVLRQPHSARNAAGSQQRIPHRHGCVTPWWHHSNFETCKNCPWSGKKIKFSSTTEQKHNNKKDLIKSNLLHNGYWSVMMMCIDTGQKSNFLLH